MNDTESETGFASGADSGSDADSGSAVTDSPRALRIVRGNPTPEEVAVLTAVVSAAVAAGSPPAAEPRRGRWNDPAQVHRRPLLPGPGAWRTAGR